MNMNAMMASQLQSLQSLVQMSVMNKSLAMSVSAAEEMLESAPKVEAIHPHKGQSIDVKG